MDINLVLKPIVIMIISLVFIIGSIIFSIPIYYGFLAGIIFTSIVFLKSGYSFKELKKTILAAIWEIKSLLIVIMFIGATTSIWLASGVVPIIMYYGFSYMEGINFLLAAFLIMCLVSMFMGTAIGTLSTVGISLSGIGLGMGIPYNLMVGVLVSGAFVADKISPLSGLINLIMTTVNRSYKQIFKSMITTLIPTIIITAIIYFIIGTNYSTGNTEKLILYKEAIFEGFNTNPILLILPLTVLLLSILGLNSIVTFSIGIGVGALLSVIFQKSSILFVIKSIIFGYRGNTPSAELNNLLVSGGIVSMLEAIFIVIGAYLLVKLFEKGNILLPLMDKLVYSIDSRIKLIRRTGFISILMTVVTCDQTSGIILPGTILQEKYEEFNLDNSILARTIFDTGVIVAPLMPWNINSFLIKPILGISAINYAPYALLCYLCPLISLIVSSLQFRDKK